MQGFAFGFRKPKFSTVTWCVHADVEGLIGFTVVMAPLVQVRMYYFFLQLFSKTKKTKNHKTTTADAQHQPVASRSSHTGSQRCIHFCQTGPWRASSDSRNQVSQRNQAAAHNAGRWPSLLSQTQTHDSYRHMLLNTVKYTGW